MSKTATDSDYTDSLEKENRGLLKQVLSKLDQIIATQDRHAQFLTSIGLGVELMGASAAQDAAGSQHTLGREIL